MKRFAMTALVAAISVVLSASASAICPWSGTPGNPPERYELMIPFAPDVLPGGQITVMIHNPSAGTASYTMRAIQLPWGSAQGCETGGCLGNLTRVASATPCTETCSPAASLGANAVDTILIDNLNFQGTLVIQVDYTGPSAGMIEAAVVRTPDNNPSNWSVEQLPLRRLRCL